MSTDLTKTRRAGTREGAPEVRLDAGDLDVEALARGNAGILADVWWCGEMAEKIATDEELPRPRDLARRKRESRRSYWYSQLAEA